MEERNDIYDFDKQIRTWNDKLDSNSDVLESNKKHLHYFFNHCLSSGLSKPRVLVYQNRLVPIASWFSKDFKETNQNDILALMGRVESASNWSDGTKNMIRVAIKKLFKVIEGNGATYPEKVKFINTTRKNNHKKLPEELLTRDEIQALIDAALQPRDKALVAVLAESGARVMELANMKIKHVLFDEYGALVQFPIGKTGARRVRLINGVHYLASWLECHPKKDDKNAFVWCQLTRNRGEPMDYQAIRVQVSKLARKAGVSKPCNLHSFRHARATELVKRNINPAQICSLLGWTLGSRQMNTYVHLASKDNDEALLKAYGIKLPNGNGKKACPRCSKELQEGLRFCGACGMPVSLSAVVELEEKRAELDVRTKGIMELLQDKDVQELLAKKMASSAP